MTEAITKAIKAKLDTLIDPFTQMPMSAARSLVGIDVKPEKVSIKLSKGYPLAAVSEQLSALVQDTMRDLQFEQRDLEVVFEQDIKMHEVGTSAKSIEGVRNIIAVASGKGGVGKSTVSANLAVALAQNGASVALLDADIYGPSQPRLLNLAEKPKAGEDNRLIPPQAYGVKVMSIGFLIEEDTPMIWRGPMVTQALEQLLRGTVWASQAEPVDYMIIDLPPGTGDIQLTLSQRVPVTAAIIVTTPQDLALLDARKAYNMFAKVRIPVLGVVENMSTHICSKCGHEEAIFGSDGGAQMAQQYELELLGQIPLQMEIRQQSDAGRPIVSVEPQVAAAKEYNALALRIAGKLSIEKQGFQTKFPNIVVEHS